MKVNSVFETPTRVTLTVIPAAAELAALKNHVLGDFQAKLKLPGFRPGRAPLGVVEKNIDANTLQTSFLEEAIHQLYPQAVAAEKLRPVDHPKISIKKFVPFTELELEAEVAVIGDVQLGDYKQLKAQKPSVNVTAGDVNAVVASLREQLAQKKDVGRAARAGDQVLINFKGTDAAGRAVNGAEGKDYPLILGTHRFIPGFEDKLIGLKAGQRVTFTLKLPKDYGLAALAGRKITFDVTVTKVQTVKLPPADDEFAARAGPFKSLQALRADIKKQLLAERERQAAWSHETALVRELTEKSQVEAPDALVDGQVERMLADLKQNLAYRGQTFEEFLDAAAKSDEQYRRETLRPQAEALVKSSLVLNEVAEREKLTVTPEEVEARVDELKSHYRDATMQAELDKPAARREVATRILSDKVVARLVAYASGAKTKQS